LEERAVLHSVEVWLTPRFAASQRVAGLKRLALVSLRMPWRRPCWRELANSPTTG